MSTSPIDERSIELMNSARVIHLAESIIFPWLEGRLKIETETLSSIFKAGGNTLPHVATISSLIELRQELQSKVRAGDKVIAKVNS